MPHKDLEIRKEYAKQYREKHKEKHKAYQALYRKANDFTEYKAEWYKRKRFERYNITRVDYDNMLEQQKNKCSICQVSFSETITPYIDHCHASGKVRGLLCLHCNTGLGHFKDKPMVVYRALCYLEGTPDD